MATNRPRGYRAWTPKGKTQQIMRQVIEVLEEYRDRWPLTIRQVFYRLVGVYRYDKTEQAYNRPAEFLNRARREPRDVWWSIPWEALRDDGVIERFYNGYADADEFLATVRHCASEFRLDLMQYQDVHVEVICEAGGMAPQLQTVASQYGANVSSCGGFDSTTRKHELAVRLSNIGKPVVLLHIGDYDPSGVHIAKNLDEDIWAFVEHYGGDLELVRLAVTPEQKEEYDLPTAPPKATDTRSFDSNWTVQAEALDPNDLAAIVAEGIESRIDLDVLVKSREEEEQIRIELVTRMEVA